MNTCVLESVGVVCLHHIHVNVRHGTRRTQTPHLSKHGVPLQRTLCLKARLTRRPNFLNHLCNYYGNSYSGDKQENSGKSTVFSVAATAKPLMTDLKAAIVCIFFCFDPINIIRSLQLIILCILAEAVTSLDGGNGDWGRKMPKKRETLEDKKGDLDL